MRTKPTSREIEEALGAQGAPSNEDTRNIVGRRIATERRSQAQRLGAYARSEQQFSAWLREQLTLAGFRLLATDQGYCAERGSEYTPWRSVSTDVLSDVRAGRVTSH